MRGAPVGLVLALLLTGCATADPPRAAPSPDQPCVPSRSTAGPALLQRPPVDVVGPFYAARTDGPCGLVVRFVGAPEGEGPCNVARYVGRLEPAGEDLRLVVDEEHSGAVPRGSVGCADVGAERSMRVRLDRPLEGRRVVDEQGHALQLVDGDRLLRFGELPPGWSTSDKGSGAYVPVHWETELRGPDGAYGGLHQGEASIGRPSPEEPGYRRLAAVQVRGHVAVLATVGGDPRNRVLQWVEDGQGVRLQVLGPLPDPQVLVRIADDLLG